MWLISSSFRYFGFLCWVYWMQNLASWFKDEIIIAFRGDTWFISSFWVKCSVPIFKDKDVLAGFKTLDILNSGFQWKQVTMLKSWFWKFKCEIPGDKIFTHLFSGFCSDRFPAFSLKFIRSYEYFNLQRNLSAVFPQLNLQFETLRIIWIYQSCD